MTTGCGKRTQRDLEERTRQQTLAQLTSRPRASMRLPVQTRAMFSSSSAVATTSTGATRSTICSFSRCILGSQRETLVLYTPGKLSARVRLQWLVLQPPPELTQRIRTRDRERLSPWELEPCTRRQALVSKAIEVTMRGGSLFSTTFAGAATVVLTSARPQAEVRHGPRESSYTGATFTAMAEALFSSTSPFRQSVCLLVNAAARSDAMCST